MKHALPPKVVAQLQQLRGRLARVFSPDTAVPGTVASVPSAGHCAAVAAVVKAELGGELISTLVNGQSHWFNRLNHGTVTFDVDLTGDQFGFDEVRLAPAGKLFSPARLRSPEHLNKETLERARILAERTGLETARGKLAAELVRRFEPALA